MSEQRKARYENPEPPLCCGRRVEDFTGLPAPFSGVCQRDTTAPVSADYRCTALTEGASR